MKPAGKIFKGTVHLKIKNPVIIYSTLKSLEFLSSVEHKRRYIEEWVTKQLRNLTDLIFPYNGSQRGPSTV